jgi:glycosidase
MMDFVPNHVGHMHPFFLDAKDKEDSKYHNWFIWEQWPDEYETFLDVKELPKLNTLNGAVQEHLIGAALFWLDHGVDHLRFGLFSWYF